MKRSGLFQAPPPHLPNDGSIEATWIQEAKDFQANQKTKDDQFQKDVVGKSDYKRSDPLNMSRRNRQGPLGSGYKLIGGNFLPNHQFKEGDETKGKIKTKLMRKYITNPIIRRYNDYVKDNKGVLGLNVVKNQEGITQKENDAKWANMKQEDKDAANEKARRNELRRDRMLQKYIEEQNKANMERMEGIAKRSFEMGNKLQDDAGKYTLLLNHRIN